MKLKLLASQVLKGLFMAVAIVLIFCTLAGMTFASLQDLNFAVTMLMFIHFLHLFKD